MLSSTRYKVRQLSTCNYVHCLRVVASGFQGNPNTICPRKTCVPLPPPVHDDIMEDRAFAIRVGMIETMANDEARKQANLGYGETVPTNDPNYMFDTYDDGDIDCALRR